MSSWALPAVEALESRHFLSGGGLDRTFGDDGVLLFNRYEVNPEVIEFEPSGKLLLASRQSILRFTVTGAPDKAFGDNGKLDVGFHAAGVQVLEDGKIVVGGSIGNQWAVARYNRDWTPDASFGNNGRTITSIGEPTLGESATTMDVFPDGDIVLAGSHLPNDPEYDMDFPLIAITRFNGDGSVDRGFDGDGKLITGSGYWMNYAENVLAKRDGNLILLGHVSSGGHTNWALLAEYDSKGQPVQGASYAPLPNENTGNYLGGAVRPDGAVVISQSDNRTPPSRLFLNGRPIDVDFSPGVDSVEDIAGPVTSDPRNRIIVAGRGGGGLGVQIFKKDGTPDASFGIGGSASSKPEGTRDSGLAVAVAPDGDVLVSTEVADYNQFMLVRFDAQDGPDRTRRPTARVVRSSYRPKHGARRLAFEVEYTAEVRITRRSLDDDDIVVRGPNGYRANATLKDFRKTPRGRIVEYVIAPPGKRWDRSDDGVYHVSVRGQQVFDNFGNAVAAGTIGQFDVQVLAPPKKDNRIA